MQKKLFNFALKLYKNILLHNFTQKMLPNKVKVCYSKNYILCYNTIVVILY